MSRLPFLVIVAIGLGVCTASASDATRSGSLDRLVEAAAPQRPEYQAAASGQLVMASLPSQRIRTVNGTTHDGGFHQIIELDRSVPGLHPNTIEIRYRRTIDRAEASDMQKPTESGIRDELTTRFPNMKMLVVDRPRNNAYGVYGLAVGKWANGASCIYAWQWADSGATRNTSDAFDALSLRISLCRTGATLDDLASLIDGLRIGPSRFKAVPGDHDSRSSRLAERGPVARRARSRPAVATTARARPQPSRMTQYVAQAPLVADQSKLAAADPTLDPSLPAAAYQGPTINAPIHRAVQ